jgi:predicted  nucleic acid-binding Zn-ribbon protein
VPNPKGPGFAELESLHLSSTIEQVLDLAVQYAGSNKVDAEAFLRAAAFYGQSASRSSARLLADILKRRIGPNQRPWLFGRPQPKGGISPAPGPTIGPDLAQAFGLAVSLRTRTGGKDNFIGLRHVLFALATCPATIEAVNSILTHAGINAQSLATQLVPFLQDSLEPGENWNVWLEIFGQNGLSAPPAPAASTPPLPESQPAPDSPATDSHTMGALVPLSLDGLELSDGARAVLVDAAKRHTVLSTGILFMELAERGRSRGEAYWAADFLTQAIVPFAAKYSATGEAYMKSLGSTHSGDTSLRATAGAAYVLSSAAALAEQTTGDRHISARHLLAALIIDPPKPHRLGSLKFAEEIGIHPPLLRQNYFEWLRGYGDNDDTWRLCLLGADAAPQQLTGFNADDTGGPDLLDVQRDVRALATLIAARSLVPPLSIGLFGDWGSGKTFLMGQLQTMVGQLSKVARDGNKPQREEPFFKHIVQIVFNAWHYVEGNLWASLVEHIFRNLRQMDTAGQTSVETMQKHWIEQLGFKETALAAATGRVQAAKRRIDSAEEKVAGLRKEHEAKTDELQHLSARSAARDFRLAGVPKILNEALASLGLQPVSDAVTDLHSSLRQARSVLERGNTALTPLIHASDRRARWLSLLIILIGGPAAGLLVGATLHMLGKDGIREISSIAAAAAAMLTTGAAWMRRQAGWMSARLDEVEKANRSYDEELGKQQAAMAEAIARKEQELALARQEYAAAQQAADQARRDHEVVRQELADATPGQLLGKFIEDRAASTDYRKHLGVLAVIRDDFQELSKLIEQENDRLSNLKSVEEEKRNQDKRVNRIVLYIDDLDRCPPNKVIDVLQAVHLLLAFPLFVVVVGVDARWISRSLETKYRELLRIEGAEAGDAKTNEMFGALRSDDYLEKIFQVPLWLRPLDGVGVRRMVQGLLRPARAATPIPPPAHTMAAAASGSSAPASGEKPGIPASNTSSDAAILSSLPARAETTASTPSPASASAPPAANVESLEVRDFEVDVMDDLSPLLGRSPRALKRFVNVYRLIKAGLTPAELAVFVRSEPNSISAYQAVLFLLAIDTGLPQISRTVFDFLRREGAARQLRTNEEMSVENGISRLSALAAVLQSKSDWQKLNIWVRDRSQSPWLASVMPQLIAWAPRVSRYSFQAAQADQYTDQAVHDRTK